MQWLNGSQTYWIPGNNFNFVKQIQFLLRKVFLGRLSWKTLVKLLIFLYTQTDAMLNRNLFNGFNKTQSRTSYKSYFTTDFICCLLGNHWQSGHNQTE